MKYYLPKIIAGIFIIMGIYFKFLSKNPNSTLGVICLLTGAVIVFIGTKVGADDYQERLKRQKEKKANQAKQKPVKRKTYSDKKK